MNREEAIELLEDLDGAIEDNHGRDYDEAFRMAIKALSADAVEVVRCKDCKHRRDICSMRYIEMVGEDERIHDYSTDNGYCSWGERREDGDDE